MRYLLVTCAAAFALTATAQPSPPAAEETAADDKPGEHDALLEHLSRFKISGYVQARYTYEQGEDFPSQFDVRRARIKPTYTTEWAQYLIEIDATGRGVTLREAEATLYEPWTGHKLALTLGQTKWPFGWEISQSSSKRELPERARVTRAFAPNERDRGAKLDARLGLFRLNVGVFDGNGIVDDRDNDGSKDIVGRFSFDLKWLSGGVSGWWGETLRPSEDGGGFHPRNRLAFDAQLSGKPSPLGTTELRAEFMAGRTYYRSGVEQFGVPALGWYAVLVQSFGKKNQVAVRYDFFDGAAGRANSTSAGGTPSSTNAIGTVGIAVMHQFNDVIEATAAYELPMTGVAPGSTDPEDNVFTFQLQAKI